MSRGEMPIKPGDCWLPSKYITVYLVIKSRAAYNKALKGASQKEVPLQSDFGIALLHEPKSDSS